MKPKSGPKPSPFVVNAGVKEEVSVLRQKTAEMIVQKPAKAATILAEWIRQPASVRVTSKKKAG